jgi:putative tRNA adenosine deaminase-associated protein
LAAVEDDFFVAIRVVGGQASVFLSDLTAAVDWPSARQVRAHLGLDVPEHDPVDADLAKHPGELLGERPASERGQ